MSSPPSRTCSPAHADLESPAVSVVIPVFDEEESLPELIRRLTAVLDGLDRSAEVILINDGSRDGSWPLLAAAAHADPRFRAIDLVRNYGQHAAVAAGFQHVRGDLVVTLDADLQNPPEEIPRLIAAADEGYDVVGTRRGGRRDSLFLKSSSRLVNWWARKTTGATLTDYGCMLRAYRRTVVDALNRTPEASTFIPVLAELYAGRTTEIEVAHEARRHGHSHYSLLQLIWLQFDLTTSFSLAPLRLTLLLGVVLSITALAVAAVLVGGRLVLGSEWAVSGVFTVLAFLAMLIGAVLFGLGLVGEYVGRIYLEVRRRPRYLVRELVESPGGEA
jgi:undecaprenyl-phosphate 4-deoxy-4-formamido-L-arabinose transferase